jgi:hypothetical protein
LEQAFDAYDDKIAYGDKILLRTQVRVALRHVPIGPMTLCVVAMLLIATPARAGSPSLPGALVHGVVRDVQGVAQMGALVQVLAANSTPVATAITDQHGRYLIANLLPGKYMVRASATLYAPTIRDNLQLRTGGRAIVNLTLAAVFDTANWLPSDRRRADEPADDWKWTLRSTTNRPILRVLDDGETVALTAGNGELPTSQQMQARATARYSAGEFGGDGEQMLVAMNRALQGDADLLIQAEMGITGFAGDGLAPASALTAGYQRRLGFGTARTVVHYESHPEIAALPGFPTGLQAFDVRTAQQTDLGDQVQLEVGGSVRAVHEVGYAVQASPFIRVTAHPSGTWTLQYRLASAKDLQSFDDLDSPAEDVPVAVVANGRLLLEQGRHQQFTVARQIGRGTVQVAVYHDAMSNVAVAGGAGLATAGAATAPINYALAGAPAVYDASNGSLRAMAQGYDGDGVTVAIDMPLIPGMMGGLEYAAGDALASTTQNATSMATAVAALKARSAQSGTVSIRGHLGGTRVRASYRWQPAATVTAVNPYGSLNDQAYLSFAVRQPLHCRGYLPQGLDATIDVTNLLAQGYRPFLSPDGQTLYFTQAPRSIRAGLSFSF